MDLKYIKTFKTIIEVDGFRNASYKLGCTQSTVTFHIQQLEAELQLKLFEKIGRKMILTQEARQVLPIFDNILLSIDQIKNHHKKLEEMTGNLRIAMSETLLIYKMQDILKEFKEKAPNIKLSLQGMDCYRVRQSLINGDIDLGIHYDISKYNDAIVTHDLKEFDLTLVSSSSLKNEYKDFIQENQNKPFSLVSNTPKNPFKNIFSQYLKNKNIQLSNILEVGSIEATKRSIISNLGISYLPKFTLERELKNGELIELEHEIETTNIKALYAHHKNKHITKEMNLFIDLLKQTI